MQKLGQASEVRVNYLTIEKERERQENVIHVCHCYFFLQYLKGRKYNKEKEIFFRYLLFGYKNFEISKRKKKE